jgi:hypothetical protein
MKSFNEFVSIKESRWNAAVLMNNIKASKEDILKMVQKINGILNSMPGTFGEAMAVKRESGKLEFAMMSMVKGLDLDSVKKEYGDPLVLIQRIQRVLQSIPGTVREALELKKLAGEVALKINALPEYHQLNAEIQQKISKFPPAPN